jgi:poly(3-hydroxybutyrate) depolymerase
MLRSRQNMAFRCHLPRRKAPAHYSQLTQCFNRHLATFKLVLSLLTRLEVLALLTLVTLCAGQTDTKPQKSSLSFGGTARTYSLFVPSGLTTPSPLLLLLHGSAQDSESLIATWQEIAQREGIILMAPDSIDPAAWDSLEDSPDLLHATIDAVKANHPVDDHRLYLFGTSTGADYALYLSIVEAEYFAATAIHSGSLLASNFRLIGAAKRKIPISIWSAVDDASVSLEQVRATRDAFNARGFAVELHEIAAHDQNANARSSDENLSAWQFLSAHKLEKNPEFNALAQLQYPLLKTNDRTPRTIQQMTPQSFDSSIWANAKPYLDDPPAQLITAVAELQGIAPAPDQQQLPDILKKIGAKSLDLLRRMPNVISHESVVTKILQPHGPTFHQKFEYLVLRHDANGVASLDEFRTDKANSGATPLAQGSANMWVIFHPGNLYESRFRCLGRQHMDGHATIVVAFAQIPDKVRFPGEVKLQGQSVPVLYQGIAWVDESDFRIVRLRTDLLAPRPDIYLRTLTREVLFSDVRLPETSELLWLPQEATVTTDFKGQTMQQIYKYSGFRLYQAKSRIVF